MFFDEEFVVEFVGAAGGDARRQMEKIRSVNQIDDFRGSFDGHGIGVERLVQTDASDTTATSELD